MVAVIKTGSSIHRIFNYNELKVEEGVAECLAAENYPKDLDDLSLQNKLNRLLNQVKLNDRVHRNSVHISLNFAPGEDLAKGKLTDIAREYMEAIGFGDQPYLVYQHHDAGHPHLHLVSIKIRADGTRIDTQYIGRDRSEPARRAIEVKHSLVRAEDHRRTAFNLKAVDAKRVTYGKAPTKRAVQNVLNTVLNTYIFASLSELNAVLGLYNISAERGTEDSLIYKNGGLVYRVLDEYKTPIGVPIKASDFHSKPTLKALKELFLTNVKAKDKLKPSIKSMIDMALFGDQKVTYNKLLSVLKDNGIDVVERRNANGFIYGLTYIDHRNHVVFNGSDLGKSYSAKGIQERCAGSGQKAKTTYSLSFQQQNGTQKSFCYYPIDPGTGGQSRLANILFSQPDMPDQMGFEFQGNGKKRKKKRRSQHL